MNTITGYCLNPQNYFSLEEISKKSPRPWMTEEGFTKYIPEEFDGLELQNSVLSSEKGNRQLLLSYSEGDTPMGADSLLRWEIKKQANPVATVNLDTPESYDLRLIDGIDSSDIHGLGLYGQMPQEEIDTLSNPVFAIEDISEDVIAGRIFESYTSYFPQPYIQLSVLYPDNTVISFSGHQKPADLYELLKALPN